MIFEEVVRLSVGPTYATPTTELASLSVHLSSVCKRWRSVALVVPALWAFIYIPEPCAKGTTELVSLFTSRSAPLPLRLDLSSHSTMDTLGTDFILRRTADRLGHLTFRTAVDSPTCITVPALEGFKGFPQLESLRIISLLWVRDIRLRITAPKLHSLECIAVAPAIMANELQSIKSLTLRELNVIRITRLSFIFCRMSQIEVLHLDRFTLEQEETEFQLARRVLPRLKQLTLSRMGQDALRGTLALIDAPLLEELEIREVEAPFGGWLLPPWGDISLGLFEGLKSIKMESFQSRDGPCNLSEVLKSAPNVETLSLMRGDPVAISTLVYRSDFPELGRALRKLELDAGPWPIQELATLIRSRAATLKEISAPQNLANAIKAALEGTQIDIRTS